MYEFALWSDAPTGRHLAPAFRAVSPDPDVLSGLYYVRSGDTYAALDQAFGEFIGYCR